MRTRPLMLVALVLLLATGCAPSVTHASQPVEAAVTAPSAVVTEAPAATGTPAPTASATPEVEPEAPVLAITVTNAMAFDPTLEPPSFDGVWQIVDPAAGYPDDPTAATTYLLAHARTPWRGHSPGNNWQDLAAGNPVTVDGAAYRVTWTTSVPKSQIADAPIWTHVPGRVVLITCVPLVSGEVATENRITILEPA